MTSSLKLFLLYILILYYIKLIDSKLPCVCSIIDHRGRQNVVRTCATFLFLPHFDVSCDLSLNRRTATWNLFVKQTKQDLVIVSKNMHYGEQKESKRKKMLELLMSTRKKLSLREQENAHLWSLLQRLFDSVAKCFIPKGWLLVANSVSNFTSPSRWTAESSYRGVRNFTNNKMGITVSALKELRSHLSFTQLRFHCSKKQGRTFRVTTVSNSTGEGVVQYFSGQTDVHSDSLSHQETFGKSMCAK